MSDPTPPAVSDALRDAVASYDAVVRAMRTFELWGGPLRYREEQKWHVRDIMAMRKVLEEAAGPIASEIARLTERAERAEALLGASLADVARLTGERDAARHGCPIGLDASPGICSAGTCYVCISDRCMDACNRAEAAEAETARLRAALEAAATRFSDIAAGRAFQPRPHAATGATEARAALSSQEQADV